jgi:hypothetical protein
MNEVNVPGDAPSEAARWISLTRVVIVSTLVGLLVGLMSDTFAALIDNIVISNAFGISIYTLSRALMRFSNGRIGFVPAILMSAPVGVLIGGKIAALVGVDDLIGHWMRDPQHYWRSMLLVTLLVTLSSTFIFNQARKTDYRLQLERERRLGLEASKAQVVAQLGLLQAQIEPHFLFNTLAHVQSAIDQDPALGKVMLENLIRYLRGTLTRSRLATYTVLEEQELIEALLAIAAIRLGRRLSYSVQLSSVRTARLPPLLLQPLVENAIKHGIEPAIDGGEILVSGEIDGEFLTLRVADTGGGVTIGNPEGVGLANVRERLASLYGHAGRLRLERNSPRGTVAELRLPLKGS